MYDFIDYKEKIHRIVPSKFPPITLFDWARSKEELEQIAYLEGLTNERIQEELGRINLIPKEDWIYGSGSTPVMSAFTHIGYPSRFSDGSYGVYYAASSLMTAIRETAYHRTIFYSASKEPTCSISMREYIATVKNPMVDIRHENYIEFHNPDPLSYTKTQAFGKTIKEEKHWGLLYPSARHQTGMCVAVFRPPALTLPIQGCHLKYIWNGIQISEVYKESKVK